MKLIYAYIKHFRNIDNQEIYFSSGYKVTYNPSLSFPNSLTISLTSNKPVLDIIYQKICLLHIGSSGQKTPCDGTLLPEQDGNTAKTLNGYCYLIPQYNQSFQFYD